MYKALVRPHPEYCVPFKSPVFTKNELKPKQVQIRATGMLRRVGGPEELSLFSLPKQRPRRDMIAGFKYVMVGGVVNTREGKQLFKLKDNGISSTNGHKNWPLLNLDWKFEKCLGSITV